MSEEVFYLILKLLGAFVALWVLTNILEDALASIGFRLHNIENSMKTIANCIKTYTDWNLLGYEDGMKIGEKKAYNEIMYKFGELADKLYEESEERKNGTKQ